MYNKINLFPDISYDYLIVKTGRATRAEVTTMNGKFLLPTWTTILDTIIVAPFTNNLVSSVIDNLNSPLVSWIVYRQKIGDSRVYKVAEVDKNSTKIIDYLVANNTEYKWTVVPITENEVGVSLESDYIKMCWWDWSLSGLIEVSKNVYTVDSVWLFDLNLTSDNAQQEMDKTKFKTYTQYPKFSIGQSDYLSGGIKCLLGNMNSVTHQYDENVEKYNAWLDFCYKARPCLLKDRKGNIRVVNITENSSKTLDQVGIQPNEISFSWCEIGNVNEISVYSNDL